MGIDKTQLYHLEPPRGLINDPNGLVYFRGNYYIFFQWNRFEKNHSYKEWGLFVSKDLVSWTFEGSAILPDQPYDLNGIYSGSSCVVDNELYLFYTGNSKQENRRVSSQCLAISREGRTFLKKGIVMKTPEEYTEHFRDPKVWKGNGNGYYMVVGAQQRNGKGAIALCRSEDGLEWKYCHRLAVSSVYEMIECPDLFEVDDSHVLLYNPQKRNNEQDVPGFSFSAYKIVKFDEETGTLNDAELDSGSVRLDYGFDFYAPQTFLNHDGRRILLGWMSRMDATQELEFGRNETHVHCLTLPRELRISEGKLFQRPTHEMYQMLGAKVHITQDIGDRIQANPADRTFYIRISHIKGSDQMSMDFHGGEAGFRFNCEQKKAVFTRINWVSGESESTECEILTLEELEVWSDRASIEIFLNKGEAVFSSRIFPGCSKPKIIINGIKSSDTVVINEIMGEKVRGGKVNE